MRQLNTSDLDRALALLPSGTFLLTAAHENDRAGARVGSVAQCATEPLLLSVALRKGHSIEPLIRDSHAFAVCRVNPQDRLLLRKFSEHSAPDENADPFDSLPVERLATGAPVLKRSLLAFDCEVVRHFDLEADHELYVGQVLDVRIYADLDAPGDHGQPNGTP